MKFVTCLLVIFAQERFSISALGAQLRVSLALSEVAKLSVPSFLYTVQNNLLYFALKHLDAAPYQVCYQLKILTTAVFSVFMLKRRLTRLKWLSLVILTVGVAIVQLHPT